MKRWLRRIGAAYAPRVAADPVTDPAIRARSASRTHLGHVRAINEDRVLDDAASGIWAVADGMGGHARGDLAAETALGCLAGIGAGADARRVTDALAEANRAIRTLGDGRSGTTLVMLTLDRMLATIRWIGDSRAYLIRGGGLELVTRDHSLVQDLVDAGLLDAAQASGHPQSNVITRALGVAEDAQFECLTLALAPGDRVLLCSDGLSRSLDAADFDGPAELDSLADRLLAHALERDGSDNISLVLVEPAG